MPGGTAPPNANKISIITKSEIRYEGVLYNINPQDQNITLCNVKSFGTEGRRPGNELAPSPQIHDYIIFRGTDIKDLKVLEQGTAQPETTTKEQTQTQTQQNVETQPTNVQKTETESKDIKMKSGDDFDFNDMQKKFQQFTLEHKPSDVHVKSYDQSNFFDDISTSTSEKTREIPFDRMAQKKVDKETFGSEYVDTATHRGGRGGRGGRGRGSYRGGYNRNYQGGGYNRNYGGGNYQGGQNKSGYGGGNYYKGGQNRNYGGGEQGQGRKYGGDHGGYGGGHQGGNRGGYGGNQGGYGGNQGGYGGNQGGYGGNQGGYGGNQGPRYYKTYQTVDSNQQQNQ